ncbi:PREDICTED: pentatricopeptide repeat-containing protein At3g60960, mitochondrial-like [Camelina sativa]|uniref:Pentatricopeptide repeat-containing protein At3g60960, mitochondrial-like n=1 Tax=Camelina sativa TaxID=90675 RepID=A0ABM0TUL2_CAMSA|nr:PREDICTED: pentatricopeptide repeat-containing protein At3g60960, mitochondrial-like [Camelina sativa]
MSLLGRIKAQNLRPSKGFICFMRRQITSSTVTYPLGRRDPYTLPLELTQKLEDPLDVSLDTRPISLHYRVAANLELSALDNAAKISRYAALDRFRCSHTTDTCNSIIYAMCLAKRYEDAIALFHYFFNKSNILPNTFSFDLIIKIHCDEGHVDDALQLYHHYNAFLAPESNTSTLLAQALVDAGRINEALVLARSADVDWRVYNVLVRGFLNLGNYQWAHKLFEEDKASTCDEEGITFVASTLLDYCLEQGNKVAMLYCPRKIELLSGNKVLEVFLKHGQTSLARQYFRIMLDKSIFDSETINIVVNEYFKNSEFGEAMETFKRVPPEIRRDSYSNIITRLCERGMASEAEPLLAEMSSPDIATFRAMIDGYVRVGRVDDAIRIFNKMVAASLRKLAIHHAF